MLASRLEVKLSEEGIRHAFELLDVDCSGVLSIFELQEIFTKNKDSGEESVEFWN